MGSQKIRCRQIRDSDISEVAELLSRGFPGRASDFWRSGLVKLSERASISDYPKLGHLLLVDERIVGAVLTIYAHGEEGGKTYPRCNVSSWFVEPEFSSYGALLASAATRRSEVTYLNISAAPHTRPIVEALGFKSLCEGLFIAFPYLTASAKGSRVFSFTDAGSLRQQLSNYEQDLMREHARLGCLALICESKGEAFPFIFYESGIWRDRIRCLHLGFSRHIPSFVSCAGALGRALWRRSALMSVDSNGPVAGLEGKFRRRGNKYYKGSVKPRLGDLSYVEDAFLR
jgi:hypothetical protein